MTTTCPYCRAAIAPEDPTVTCSRCALPYHAECWRENGRCATYGCGGQATLGSGGGADVGAPVEVTLEAVEPSEPWRAPLPAPRGEPMRRPLLLVACEVLAVVGLLVGGVAGFAEGARAGLGGALVGLLLGGVLGFIAGGLAAPVGMVLACWYAAMWGGQESRVAGALAALTLCLVVCGLLSAIRVRSWPPLFR